MVEGAEAEWDAKAVVAIVAEDGEKAERRPSD
jgi:hypothetical protein